MSIEADRIISVYAKRDKKKYLYAWHRPEINYQEGEKNAVIASLLSRTYGTDLSECGILDVGCGVGSFLRNLVEWGAQPSLMLGTERLKDRLKIAQSRSPSNLKYQLGDLGDDVSDSFDLVTAHTVFSSILDHVERRKFALAMWRVLKPGGWLLVFDFRYNNPSNKNVRKVDYSELLDYWGGGQNCHYRTLLLAPPLARRIFPVSPLLAHFLTTVFPFLRSHFCFMLQKPIVRLH